MKLKSSLTSKTCAIAAFVFGTGLVHAGPILYTVSSSYFAPSGMGIDLATFSGTIETDGSIGALSSSDVLSWSLLLNNGIGQTFTINPGNSTLTMTGTATTATASLLQFNYDTSVSAGALGYLEFLDSTDGWGLFFSGPSGGTNGGIINPINGAFTSGLPGFDPQPITLGTTGPEPSTFLLLLSSLLGIVAVRARFRVRGNSH